MKIVVHVDVDIIINVNMLVEHVEDVEQHDMVKVEVEEQDVGYLQDVYEEEQRIGQVVQVKMEDVDGKYLNVIFVLFVDIEEIEIIQQVQN